MPFFGEVLRKKKDLSSNRGSALLRLPLVQPD
jgi:hypothetical protein